MPPRKDDPPEPTAEELANSVYYNSFVAAFGEQNAKGIVECGLHHRTRLRVEPFLDCLIVALTYECFLPPYSNQHNFTIMTADAFRWCRDNDVDFAEYKGKGDVADYYAKKLVEL